MNQLLDLERREQRDMEVSSITIRGSSVRKVAFALWVCMSVGVAAITQAQAPCARIIALSPSLVEVVAAINVSENLVGVSRFTKFPESAKKLAQVGGFLDPNLEAMVLLKPTVVFGLSEHSDLIGKLKKLGIRSETYDHRSVAGILDSITKVGALCERVNQSASLINELATTLQSYKSKLVGKKRVRALVLIGGKEDAIHFTNLYVSGRDGYYADLLELAGGMNVFSGITRPFSGVSRESFIKQDPEFIFHIITDADISSADRRAIMAAWGELPYLRAVKERKVFLLTDYVDVIPGPRFPETLEKIASAIEGGN